MYVDIKLSAHTFALWHENSISSVPGRQCFMLLCQTAPHTRRWLRVCTLILKHWSLCVCVCVCRTANVINGWRNPNHISFIDHKMCLLYLAHTCITNTRWLFTHTHTLYTWSYGNAYVCVWRWHNPFVALFRRRLSSDLWHAHPFLPLPHSSNCDERNQYIP